MFIAGTCRPCHGKRRSRRIPGKDTRDARSGPFINYCSRLGPLPAIRQRSTGRDHGHLFIAFGTTTTLGTRHSIRISDTLCIERHLLLASGICSKFPLFSSPRIRAARPGLPMELTSRSLAWFSRWISCTWHLSGHLDTSWGWPRYEDPWSRYMGIRDPSALIGQTEGTFGAVI